MLPYLGLCVKVLGCVGGGDPVSRWASISVAHLFTGTASSREPISRTLVLERGLHPCPIYIPKTIIIYESPKDFLVHTRNKANNSWLNKAYNS